MSEFYKKILDNNKKWVESKLELDSDYFKDLSKGASCQGSKQISSLDCDDCKTHRAQ